MLFKTSYFIVLIKLLSFIEKMEYLLIKPLFQKDLHNDIINIGNLVNIKKGENYHDNFRHTKF